MKKRILSILLTACLLVGLLPTVALAVDNVSYLDSNGQSKKQSGVTAVTSSDTGWGTSGQTKWYVVNSNVTISGVTVSGNVHLILADGCTLTVNGSIKVEGSDTLTIYGQSGGSGTLNVNNTDDQAAGIGGGYTTSEIKGPLGMPQTVYTGNSSGAITINGGRVKANSRHGAAIGGGGGGTSTSGGAGTVTIYGGTVTATSTGLGTAIGGGGSSVTGGAGTITIKGGIVTAEATLAATGSNKGTGAAIGSGINASANITISGGIVFAAAKGLGANIGTGATLTATLLTMNRGTESAVITGGVIFRGDEGKVYGDTKLAGDLTIASPKTLEIPSGKALTIPAGKTLTLNRGITNSGSLYVDGTLTGTNNVTGNVYYPLKLVGCTATGTTTHNGAGYCKPNTSVTLSASPTPGQTYLWKTTPNTTVVNMFTNSFTMPYSTLTVEAVYTQAVSITTQPGNQTISYGNDVDLTVVAKNADGKTNGIAYQWYRVEGVTWVKLTDMTDSTLTLTKPNVGTYQYFCRVSCDGTSISSNTATVTVTRASDTVTITGDPGKTYDGQPAVLTENMYTAIGDGAATVAYKVKGAADSTYTGTAPTNAGDYTVRVTQAATTNCAESSATKNFTISPKPVTVSGITAQGKTYDGTLTAGLVCTNAEFAGKLESDTLTVTATGAFSDKDVGPDKTVNITNLTLDGASKANYTLANEGQQTTTASISPKAVTVTIQPKSSACGAAIAALTATDNGIVSGDTNVYILSTTATSSSPVGSYDITGEGTSVNYSFTFENGTGAYTIVPGDLNDAAVSLTGWTYGGEPNTPVVTGNSENAAVSYQYKVKDADDSTYSDVVPTGAGDYTVKATIAASTNYNEKTVTGDFTIAPKVLTVTGLTATDRAYASENTSVELSGGTLDGIVGNDDVTATMPTTGTIESADAGENKPVTFGEITLTGSNASNYTLTQPTVTVNISKVDPNVGEVSYAGGTIYTTTPLNSITLSKTGSALGELRLTDNQTL
ncbi:MAG: YDG domain-containing protein, partial [Firmicutes bacterium]|nr:YDG domain-containing protein [Bacillota bacterium]